MEEKKLLIVGLDPGMTTGYAVLDIEGKLIHLYSSKQLHLNALISSTINLGKTVLVGTDKAKVPGLVEAFATKLGARIVSPEEDLKVEEKRKLVNSYSFEDEHQSDALASALSVYKENRALLDRIDIFVKENKKHGIKNRIKELVITKKTSIKSAVSIIEKKEEEDKVMEKVIVEKRLSESDFLKLYNKLKAYEAEIKIIKRHNNNLKSIVYNLERKNLKTEKPKINDKRILDFKEKRVRFLENSIKNKEKDFEYLKSSLSKLSNILSNINSFCILKKLDTLGITEFDFKNKVLNIQSNDMLLVDNPNIVSNSVVEFLKNKVYIIVHKKPVGRKTEDNLPFVFISAKNLRIDEQLYFGFVEKKHFEMEKNKIDWVKKIVEDYKKEKELIS